ncbi:hypothetical protein GOALK_016_00670 [Gordonia alkanivorans NBRC 16433]|uniref:Uncharacterized protein n=1 Tax=Gordonia alkanivorans NBRC 16433 TaxID=1027371 RepID=F9VQQ5_9ACTN|nr:hypothetical protein GOALK_016_00670 [Gordonia alkanivorans NBRC 16433]
MPVFDAANRLSEYTPFHAGSAACAGAALTIGASPTATTAATKIMIRILVPRRVRMSDWTASGPHLQRLSELSWDLVRPAGGGDHINGD